MRRGNISSELIMCDGRVRSIFLLPLVAKYLETIDVYGKCLFYVCYSDSMGVCGNVCCVPAVVKDSV